MEGGNVAEQDLFVKKNYRDSPQLLNYRDSPQLAVCIVVGLDMLSLSLLVFGRPIYRGVHEAAWRSQAEALASQKFHDQDLSTSVE